MEKHEIIERTAKMLEEHTAADVVFVTTNEDGTTVEHPLNGAQYLEDLEGNRKVMLY